MNREEDERWNRRKAFRHQAARETLTSISAMPGIRVGAVYRHTTARRDSYAEQRQQVYAALIDCLSIRLADIGEFGAIVMDGDGTDPAYRHQHRELKLATRRIVEDPLFQGAHTSQLVQIADLVAYTAYQAVYREPSRAFMHDWFIEYLRPIAELIGV